MYVEATLPVDAQFSALMQCVSSTSSVVVMQLFPFVQCKKATIHQVTTMLSTSKNVLFPGHIHLLTTSADDPTL